MPAQRSVPAHESSVLSRARLSDPDGGLAGDDARGQDGVGGGEDRAEQPGLGGAKAEERPGEDRDDAGHADQDGAEEQPQSPGPPGHLAEG